MKFCLRCGKEVEGWSEGGFECDKVRDRGCGAWVVKTITSGVYTWYCGIDIRAQEAGSGCLIVMNGEECE